MLIAIIQDITVRIVLTYLGLIQIKLDKISDKKNELAPSISSNPLIKSSQYYLQPTTQTHANSSTMQETYNSLF